MGLFWGMLAGQRVMPPPSSPRHSSGTSAASPAFAACGSGTAVGSVPSCEYPRACAPKQSSASWGGTLPLSPSPCPRHRQQKDLEFLQHHSRGDPSLVLSIPQPSSVPCLSPFPLSSGGC